MSGIVHRTIFLYIIYHWLSINLLYYHISAGWYKILRINPRMTGACVQVMCLLQRSLFSPDCQNRLCIMSGNDWCVRCLFGVCCTLFKYPSPDTFCRPLPQGARLLDCFESLYWKQIGSSGQSWTADPSMWRICDNRFTTELKDW